MKNSKARYTEVLIIAVGELIVSLLVILGYFIASAAFSFEFTYRVYTGALLGSVVMILNFAFLSLSVNRLVDEFIEIRGTREMDEEEAAEFTKIHSMKIQSRITASFVIRTVSMLATLLVAFLLDWFEPIATVIPLFMYRPILTVGNLLVGKLSARSSSGATASNEESEEKI